MPYVDDAIDPRDRRLEPMPSTPAAPAPVAGAGGGGTTASAPAAAPGGARGTGFISLERYVNANQGQAQGMADTIAGGIQGDAQKAQGELNSLQGQAAHSTAGKFEDVNPALLGQATSDASDAAAKARASTTAGGLGALLTDQYGKGGGYSSGMRGFDSFLTGNAGGTQFQNLANQYGGLDSYVGGLGNGYAPQVVSDSGPGFHPGPKSHAPITMAPPPAAMPIPVGTPAGGGGGAVEGGPGDKRKRRTE